MKRSARRLFIISGKNPLSRRGSGYAAYAYHLASVAHQLGYEVTIFCCDTDQAVIKTPVATIYCLGTKLLKLPVFRSREMAAFPFLAPLLTREIAKHLDTKGVNLVWGIGPWSLAGALLKLTGKRRLVLLAHYATSLRHEFSASVRAITIRDYGLLVKLKMLLGYATIIQFSAWLEKLLLSRVDYITTHYLSTENILLKDYQLDRAKFYRLPYALPFPAGIETRTGLKLYHPHKPLILLICRQDPRKGINFLLHALALLHERGSKFEALIVGGGTLLKANRELAKRLHLGNVHLPGFVAHPLPLLRQASLYVFPSVEEGNSAFSLLEAMRAGLPIVATRVDGIPEDLADHVSALLVPPSDPPALAEAIGQLLSNRKLAKQLGRQARSTFNQKYGTVQVRKSLQILLKHALQGGLTS